MIVCVKCGRQMRPKRNGVDVKDLARRVVDGKEEFWPYKTFMGDLMECQDCGTEVIFISPTQSPTSEHYQTNFPKFMEGAYPAKEWTR